MRGGTCTGRQFALDERMRLLRATLAFAGLSLLPACSYFHFGRITRPSTSTGDEGIAEAYANLATEHKILKQELALARKEGDALRVALDRSGGGSPAPDLLARLNETTRELATLRASYAKLQVERPAATAGGDPRFAALEEKLAGSLRDYTQLQEENARLRSEVSRMRTENLTLTVQLKTAATESKDAQTSAAQLNEELLAQKQARVRAEQATEAVRAQLALVMAQQASSTVAAAAGTRPAPSPAAVSVPATLRLAKAPPADSATAELRTSPDRLRLAAGEPLAPASQPPRCVHAVQEGDTLESIAQKYYGTAERWRTIYDANSALLNTGRPLTAGMELAIP